MATATKTWRFKTEAEMNRKFGTAWREKMCGGWARPDMDKFLGKSLGVTLKPQTKDYTGGSNPGRILVVMSQPKNIGGWTWDERLLKAPTGYKEEVRIVTGYTLLKDMPDLKKGVTFIPYGSGGAFIHRTSIKNFMYDESILKQTDWFSPTYAKQDTTLRIGIKNPVTIIVSADGSLRCTDYTMGTAFNITSIKMMIARLKYSADLAGRNYIVIGATVHFGCPDGPDVTLEQLESIVTAHNNLNQ